MIVRWRDGDQIIVNWDTIIVGWEAVTAGWESVRASWESVLAGWETRLHGVVRKISLAGESILWGVHVTITGAVQPPRSDERL